MVDGYHETDFLAVDSIANHFAVIKEIPGARSRIGCDRGDKTCTLARGLPNSPHEDAEARRWRFAGRHGGLHRTATVVAENHDQFRVAVRDREFDARQFEIG